jgi:type IV pilus assembly protein PilP
MPRSNGYFHTVILFFMSVFYISLANAQTSPTADPNLPPNPIPEANIPAAPPVPSAKPGAPPASGKPGVSGIGGSADVLLGFMDPFNYDPRGRRDPFIPPTVDKPLAAGSVHGPSLPLQNFELGELLLTGIIWNVRHPKAIVKDPKGEFYILGLNAKLGKKNGYIAAIREGEVVVIETTNDQGRLLSATQIMKIASSKK